MDSHGRNPSDLGTPTGLWQTPKEKVSGSISLGKLHASEFTEFPFPEPHACPTHCTSQHMLGYILPQQPTQVLLALRQGLLTYAGSLGSTALPATRAGEAATTWIFASHPGREVASSLWLLELLLRSDTSILFNFLRQNKSHDHT